MLQQLKKTQYYILKSFLLLQFHRILHFFGIFYLSFFKVRALGRYFQAQFLLIFWSLNVQHLSINFFYNFKAHCLWTDKAKQLFFYQQVKKKLFFYKNHQFLKLSMYSDLLNKRRSQDWKHTINYADYQNNDDMGSSSSSDLTSRYIIRARNNRKNLQYFLHWKRKKQLQFTKYISQFKFKNTRQLGNFFQHSLINMLQTSNFFFSFHQIYFFLKQNYVYVNGIVRQSGFDSIGIGDRVQIVISKIYYYYIYFFKFFCFKLFKQLDAINWRLNNFRKYNADLSQFHIHRAIFKQYSLFPRIPTNIEVDFRTLTVIYVLPFRWTWEINEIFSTYINIYFFRLYNWKFVS